MDLSGDSFMMTSFDLTFPGGRFKLKIASKRSNTIGLRERLLPGDTLNKLTGEDFIFPVYLL